MRKVQLFDFSRLGSLPFRVDVLPVDRFRFGTPEDFRAEPLLAERDFDALLREGVLRVAIVSI